MSAEPVVSRFPFSEWTDKQLRKALKQLREELPAMTFALDGDELRFECPATNEYRRRGERMAGLLRFSTDEDRGASLLVYPDEVDPDAFDEASLVASVLCRLFDGIEERHGELRPDLPFPDWPTVVGFVRDTWRVEESSEDGQTIECVLEEVAVAIARVEVDGIVWLELSATIGDGDGVTDAQLVEWSGSEVGKLVRVEDEVSFQRELPLEMLTPALFERLASAFAKRAAELAADA